MKALTIVILLVLTGCAGTTPCVEQLWEINSSHYVLRANDCCDKSVAYCDALIEKGLDAHVVVGNTRDYDIPHAWVEILLDGKAFWCDPTYGMKFKPVSHWRDRHVTHVYAQNVTAQDVRSYRKIIERRQT